MQASSSLFLHLLPMHLLLLPLLHLFEGEVAGEDEGAREGEGECDESDIIGTPQRNTTKKNKKKQKKHP